MDWQTRYKQLLTTPEEAAKIIKSNSRIYLGGGTGIPLVLEHAMVARADELENVEVDHVAIFGGGEYLDPAYSKSFRHRALFIGPNARAAVNEGRADYVPIFLSNAPSLYKEGILPLDVALVQVSPPDNHGFCSFGVEVGVTKPAAESARLIIAEFNPRMPRVLGDSFIHVSRISVGVEVDYALPELEIPRITPEQEKIGEFIADMIPDGATLQLGIGAIPNAVLRHLGSKKDLGIHSELFSDGVIQLVEKGIINNSKKTLHPGKIIGGFLFGSQKLYDFVNDNALIELHPTDYVNDPFIIAQNRRMHAINSAIEIDLTGQVCADSIGNYLYSGIGGQVDFIRGAHHSRGGRAIIALPATAHGGSSSRIVANLKPGAGVVTSRGDVDVVVTEFGIASLRGKSVCERAKALISIAHPEFRSELKDFAKQQRW
jgi:acetyl-CoA hydrolase